MEKYKMWTTYTIDIAIDGLDEDNMCILEKLIEDVVENVFCNKVKLEYFEFVLDKTSDSKLYRLRKK